MVKSNLKISKNWFSILREGSVTLAGFGLGGLLGVGMIRNPGIQSLFLAVCGFCVLLFLGFMAVDIVMGVTRKQGA